MIATPATVRSSELDAAANADGCPVLHKPVKLDMLQAALERSLGARARATADAVVAPTRGHVLIVEDDPVNATVAEGYLSVLGCSSVWVVDGAAALARSATEHFDLVLMDINMPVLDGYQTASLMRVRERERELPRMPIVALTAHGAADSRARCEAVGIDDVLGKPYTLAECAALVRRWLGGEGTATTPGAAAPSERRPAPREGEAPMSSLASIDVGVIAGLGALAAGRQSDLYPRLVGLFERSSATSLAELAAAVAARDWSTAAAVCHKLKSSAANVGAVAFANRVRELEQACHAALAERADEFVAQLVGAHPSLLDALRTQRWQATA